MHTRLTINHVRHTILAITGAAMVVSIAMLSMHPMEANVSGDLFPVTMSLEVDTTPAQDEILKRQAQVRDMIIILLTSKRYGEVSGENAQDKLKAEIIDTVNSILTKGKIKKILFTEFLFQ